MSNIETLVNLVEVALTDEAYDGGMGALTEQQLNDYVHKLAVTAVEALMDVTLQGAEEFEREPNVAIATAGEFATIWNTATPERRQGITDVIMARQDQAISCIMQDHEGLEEQLGKAMEELAAFRLMRTRVQQYADDRHAHARSQSNTLSSWRVWSDLYQILGLDVKSKG